MGFFLQFRHVRIRRLLMTFPRAETAEQIEEIEAKPFASTEPRLKEALHGVKSYLDGKPKAKVFEGTQNAPYSLQVIHSAGRFGLRAEVERPGRP